MGLLSPVKPPVLPHRSLPNVQAFLAVFVTIAFFCGRYDTADCFQHDIPRAGFPGISFNQESCGQSLSLPGSPQWRGVAPGTSVINETGREYNRENRCGFRRAKNSGSQYESVFKILLFPDSDNLDEKDVVPDEERRTVCSDPDPVPRCNLRAVPDLYYIVPLIRVFGKPYKSTFDEYPLILGNSGQILFCPVRQPDLVHRITNSVLWFSGGSR